MEAVSLIFSFFIFHISGISFYDDQKGAVKFVFRTKWGESFLAKNTWYSPSGKKNAKQYLSAVQPHKGQNFVTPGAKYDGHICNYDLARSCFKLYSQNFG